MSSEHTHIHVYMDTHRHTQTAHTQQHTAHTATHSTHTQHTHSTHTVHTLRYVKGTLLDYGMRMLIDGFLKSREALN